MAIIFSTHIQFNLKQKAVLKEWINSVIKKEKKETGDINYVFTSDEELFKMNVKYLGHNTYTDIITFDYTEKKTVNGDIFISVHRVQDNAEKFKVGFEEELHRVMIHGILHLCGYKDKSKTDSDLMRKKENTALRLLKASK
jgi:probable rRNA maturation factor